MTMTYLAPKLLVSGEVTVVAKRLLEESEENGDNDAGFQCLAEKDEEDFTVQKMHQHCFQFSQIRIYLGSLPGTANTLTVMATDCDRSTKSAYPDQPAQNLSFHSNSPFGLPGASI